MGEFYDFLGGATLLVKATLNGSFPRDIKLAKLYSRYYSGKITYNVLESGIREHTRKLFRMLREFGIEIFTDGMHRFDDLFNPLINFVDGVEPGRLSRFFECTFYFRAPVIKSRIKLKTNVPIPDWLYYSSFLAKEIFGSSFVIKQALPGPLTLATFSVDEYYRDLTSLIHVWSTEVLEPLSRMILSKVPNAVIELHEPVLASRVVSKEVKRADIREIEDLVSSLGKPMWVLTYFGDLGDIIDLVSDLLVSDKVLLGMDYRSTESPISVIKELGVKKLVVGMIDSRTTVLEKILVMKAEVEEILEAGVKEVYISNNAPLDPLPEVIAVRKLRRLGRTARGFASLTRLIG